MQGKSSQNLSIVSSWFLCVVLEWPAFPSEVPFLKRPKPHQAPTGASCPKSWIPARSLHIPVTDVACAWLCRLRHQPVRNFPHLQMCSKPCCFPEGQMESYIFDNVMNFWNASNHSKTCTSGSSNMFAGQRVAVNKTTGHGS